MKLQTTGMNTFVEMEVMKYSPIMIKTLLYNGGRACIRYGTISLVGTTN